MLGTKCGRLQLQVWIRTAGVGAVAQRNLRCTLENGFVQVKVRELTAAIRKGVNLKN